MNRSFSLLSFCLQAVLTLSLALSFPTFASSQDHDGGSGGEEGDGGGSGLSNATTLALIRTLKRGMGKCGTLDRVYLFDCYRKVYQRAANQLNGRPAYAGALAALIEVEETLDQIVKSNADPLAAKERKAFEVFTPLKASAIPKATADFERALAKAETTLLRSPQHSQLHYARIAEVVHSNKVLLRS